MKRFLTRRRFLAVSAATCTLTGAGARAERAVSHWMGSALGASASLQLVGIDARDAAPFFTAIQSEVVRLERVFSLYRTDSEISQLNRDGHLPAPSQDLLSVLGLCTSLQAATEGAFDPTIQPIFVRSAEAAVKARSVSEDDLKAVAPLLGWENVHFGADEVRLLRPGAAITLNGIAQGYITDSIAAFLQRRGFADILVDMGEIVALGRRPDGTAWRAGVAEPSGTVLRRLSLSDRALATSSPRGTVLDAAGRTGHIFDPKTGHQADACSVVSVSSPTAAVADGLSTALCVLPKSRHGEVLARFPDSRIELVI